MRLPEPRAHLPRRSIAATYRFSVTGGVGPALTGERGGLLVPIVGGSAEENPTISISPMQGEEFTQRLLTPFEERKLTLLLRQGYDVDALVRLMGAELRLQVPGTQTFAVHNNRPSDANGYPVFRRVVAHLSAIQDQHALHVEPLHFQYSWTVPAGTVTPEAFEDVYKAPFNDILIDIRPGHPGGEMPLHGRLRLRSFHEILTFIARGMDEEPEYDVPPDPRTPSIRENPVQALAIVEARRLPEEAA